MEQYSTRTAIPAILPENLGLRCLITVNPVQRVKTMIIHHKCLIVRAPNTEVRSTARTLDVDLREAVEPFIYPLNLRAII